MVCQVEAGGSYQVIKNSDIACLYGLSLNHALEYAASPGVIEKKSVAGWYFHGEYELRGRVALETPPFRERS